MAHCCRGFNPLIIASSIQSRKSASREVLMFVFQSANNRVFNSEPSYEFQKQLLVKMFQSANNRVFNSEEGTRIQRVQLWVSIR